MSKRKKPESYNVGYGKPPESGRFKKGTSGNPSGRPRRPADFDSELQRELNATVVINENGKRKVIKKSEASAKQLVNKAASGHFREQRLLASLRRDMMAKTAEQELKSQSQRDITTLSADEMDDDELWIVLGRTLAPDITEALENMILEHSLEQPGSASQKATVQKLFDQWKARRQGLNR